jgi:hypothetical protein
MLHFGFKFSCPHVIAPIPPLFLRPSSAFQEEAPPLRYTNPHSVGWPACQWWVVYDWPHKSSSVSARGVSSRSRRSPYLVLRAGLLNSSNFHCRNPFFIHDFVFSFFAVSLLLSTPSFCPIRIIRDVPLSFSCSTSHIQGSQRPCSTCLSYRQRTPTTCTFSLTVWSDSLGQRSCVVFRFTTVSFMR